MRKILFLATLMSLAMVGVGCQKDKLKAEDVVINKESVNLWVDESVTLIAKVYPTGAPEAAKVVVWESKNPGIATVNAQTGEVTAIAVGETDITATLKNGATATCKVIVSNPSGVKGVINKKDVDLKVGDTETLTVKVYPTSTPEADKAVVWSSADETIATIDAEGVVTAVKPGKTIITGTLKGDEKVYCNVNVLETAYFTIEQTSATATEFSIIADGLVTIYWGDGNVDTFTGGQVISNRKHTYATKQSYTVAISSEGLRRLDFAGYSGYWTAIDVSQCKKLHRMDLSWTKLAELDFSANIEMDTIFAKYVSTLTSVNITGLTKLSQFQLANCPINAIDLSTNVNLRNLEITGTNIISFDLSALKKVKEVNCGNNEQMISFIATNLPEVDLIYIDGSPNLASIDVSGSTVTQLQTAGPGWGSNPKGKLTSLNVTGCTALETLNAGYQILASVDVSSCKNMRMLTLRDNLLTSLTVSSQYTNVCTMSLINNQLSATALNAIFTALPTAATGGTSTLKIYNNTGTASCTASIATAKSWTVDTTTSW